MNKESKKVCNIIIMRGISGSGKSSLAKAIVENFGLICSADDYFIGKDGSYNFKLSDLGKAHAYCKNKCKSLMSENHSPIIIDNTNTEDWEFNEYEQLADKYGYRVYHIVIENRHGGKDLHNVPVDTLNKQKDNLKNSILL